MSISQSLYKKPTWLWLLAPFSALFWAVQLFRRTAFTLNIFARYRSKLPVVIVGNITAGGNGKTPVVLALVEYYIAQGVTPAVLSRGYGGNQTSFPHLVSKECIASLVGDEPCLIRQRYDIPVVIDPDRARGAKFISSLTNAEVIICDDGLQHYPLERDMEICVMDERGIGNGYLLPMGPMRETSDRIDLVDYVLFNGKDYSTLSCLNNIDTDIASFSLAPNAWVNVSNEKELSIQEGIDYFAGKSLVAMAGIGDPQRYFTALTNMGLAINDTKAFADHKHFSKNDIPQNTLVLMTEKDAVKCKIFAHSDCWYLRVNADIPAAFYNALDEKMINLIGEKQHGV